jgi:uracil-DNA glycosylase
VVIGNIDITSKIALNVRTLLPFLPKPILQYSSNAALILIGQGPGIKVHQSNKPLNDVSGKGYALG